MVDFTLLPVLFPVIVAAGGAALTRNIMLGGGAGVATWSLIAVKTDNAFMTGGLYLGIVMFAFATAKMLAELVMGDTA